MELFHPKHSETSWKINGKNNLKVTSPHIFSSLFVAQLMMAILPLRRGRADGFSMDALLQLRTVKATQAWCGGGAGYKGIAGIARSLGY